MAAINLKEVVTEALTALGGSATAADVREYLRTKYGKDWKHVETVMDDLSVESESSFFPPEERVLRRMGQGKYALKEITNPEPISTELTTEKPKPAASAAVQPVLEETIASYAEKLKQVLNQPTHRFAEVASDQVPATSGVYLIHDNKSNQTIYTAETSNLRTHLLQQHEGGDIEWSQFRKALGEKNNLDNEARISEYIIGNCSFQFLTVENLEERMGLKHFIIAVLAPTLNTNLKSAFSQ